MKRTAHEAELHDRQAAQYAEHHHDQAGQGGLWSTVAGRNRGGRNQGGGNQGVGNNGGGNQAGRNQGRRQRPVQQGTAQVKVDGCEAAPYDVVIGNTNPGSTEEIIKRVLVHVSENMAEGLKLKEPLEILEVECLTKPREDGRRIWTRTWRVQVPSKFKDHILRPEAFPAGWTTRRYIPPRAPRPPVPELDPTGTQPPERKLTWASRLPPNKRKWLLQH